MDGSSLVNDVHAGLNPTRVAGVAQPSSIDELRRLVCEAGAAGASLAVCGARHAMGGQQFLRDGLLIDMRRLGQDHLQCGRLAQQADDLAFVDVHGHARERMHRPIVGVDPLEAQH